MFPLLNFKNPLNIVNGYQKKKKKKKKYIYVIIFFQVMITINLVPMSLLYIVRNKCLT